MKPGAGTAGNAERFSCVGALNWRNPASGVLFVLASATIVLAYGPQLRAFELVILIGLLVSAARIDAEFFIIPNRIILAGIIVRAIFVVLYGCLGVEAWAPLFSRTLVGGLSTSVPVLLLALVMDAILGRQSLGGGDIKLLFMVGLFFEWSTNLIALFVACIIAVVYGIAAGWRAEGKGGGEERKSDQEPKHDGLASGPPIPFAVPIAVAYWLVILFGGSLSRVLFMG